MEAEHNLELQAELSTNIRNNLNKYESYWKYNLVEGINLVHYRDIIYVPRTLRKKVFKWFNSCLQHPGGDRIAHKLTTVCRWSGIVEQAYKLFRTCKDYQKLKNCNIRHGLIPAKDA